MFFHHSDLIYCHGDKGAIQNHIMPRTIMISPCQERGGHDTIGSNRTLRIMHLQEATMKAVQYELGQSSLHFNAN